jgi:hypothetical protein
MGHWHEHNTVTDTETDMFRLALLRFVLFELATPLMTI